LTGVDGKTETIILDIFNQLKKAGKILLISSHDWDENIDQFDRLLLLNNHLIADGKPQQVINQENIKQAYGGLFPHHHRQQGNDLIC
jgi:manganese/iron transport system ATP-binding protein